MLALASFRQKGLIGRTLSLALKDEIPLQDVVLLLERLFANPQAREKTWRFVKERWSKLGPRISPGLAGRFVGALPALQTPRYRREVERFFAEHPLPTAERSLKQGCHFR